MNSYPVWRLRSRMRTLGILGDAGVGAVEHDRVLSDHLQVVHNCRQLAVVLAVQPCLDLRQRERQRYPSVVEQPLCDMKATLHETQSLQTGSPGCVTIS